MCALQMALVGLLSLVWRAMALMRSCWGAVAQAPQTEARITRRPIALSHEDGGASAQTTGWAARAARKRERRELKFGRLRAKSKAWKAGARARELAEFCAMVDAVITGANVNPGTVANLTTNSGSGRYGVRHAQQKLALEYCEDSAILSFSKKMCSFIKRSLQRAHRQRAQRQRRRRNRRRQQPVLGSAVRFARYALVLIAVMHAVVQPAAASDPAAAAASAAGSVLKSAVGSAVLVGSAAVASAAAAGGSAAGEDPAPAIPKRRGRKEKAKKNGKWDEEKSLVERTAVVCGLSEHLLLLLRQTSSSLSG